jgi:hypothetical protein
MALKATLASFRIGAHLLIRDTGIEAAVTAHQLAIELFRLGQQPTVDRIVDPSEGSEYCGYRVLLIRDSDNLEPSYMLRKAAESLGLEVE